MQLLKIWVKEDNDTITPSQVVEGLKANGGLLSTDVELVNYNSELLSSLTSEIELLEKVFKKFVRRENDIIFTFPNEWPIKINTSKPTSNTNSVNRITYQSCPIFIATAFEYSNVGIGRSVLCNPKNGTCILQSGSSLSDIHMEANDDIIIDLHESIAYADTNIEDDSDDDFEEEDIDEEVARHFTAKEITVGEITGIKITTHDGLHQRTKSVVKSTKKQMDDIVNKCIVEQKDLLALAMKRAM